MKSITKCDHCGKPAEPAFAWTLQACANKRRKNKFQLCRACDIELNRLTLEFFNHKNAASLAANYDP